MKIMTVVGARPQFIKAATVSRAIAYHNANPANKPIDEFIVHTGQHYDYTMSSVFFEEMQIVRPEKNLGVRSCSRTEMIGRIMAGVEALIKDSRPDLTLVYGDTNSTIAGALAAKAHQVPVAHVEAGLRSFRRTMPEELNRLTTDHLAQYLLTPSQLAKQNLADEGISEGVHVVGDVMYDAVLYYRPLAVAPRTTEPFALATVHRSENTDDRNHLGTILEVLQQCPVPVVLPLHPRTKKAMGEFGFQADGNIIFIEPLSYFEMLGHLDKCSFVVTDSGGLQKEAAFFCKKCITLREETEWTELVDCGANRLVGTGPEHMKEVYQWATVPMDSPPQVYGNGNAARLIVDILSSQ